MRNKTKNYTIFWVALFGLTSMLFLQNTQGSGVYRPPQPPLWITYGFSQEDIKQGKELFKGSQLIGPKGKTCSVCHEKDQQVPLKRSSLKKKVKQMGNLINLCLTDPTRSEGQSIEFGEPQMIQIGAYLISRYRLPSKTIKYLK